MKKVLTVLCFSVILFAAQNVSAQAEIDKGNVLLNGGFGFGYYYAGGVPILFSADFAINDAITIGPYLGFTSWRRNYFGYRWSYTFIDFGARGAYHFSKHIDNLTPKLDLYGGVMLGYRVASYSYSGALDLDNDYPSAVTAGLFGGARYYFTDRFAAYGELGYGVAPLMLGVTFKL
ncbi:MAG TPA: hypothetical protein VKZ68_02865 [Ohtaekwangia sp.]|nr:hypothetical protein [Ohtaekwangia sp.]